MRQRYTTHPDDAHGTSSCPMAHGTADAKRLVLPDRRHVETWVALEAARQRNTEEHRGGRVAEDLVGPEPRRERPSEFVRRSRVLRTSDAVERAA
ncbi:hypothetical protein GCM10009627_05500 [Curtobacterium herbarum]|uniref:Uncharacterized protein n=1 Tax=Curtobacterium herbarum TaxID=150122 RepID=A0ABN1Z9G4_9MICO